MCNHGCMAGKKNELGATGRTVAANVKWFREVQNLTYAELARRLEAVGRTIPVLGLSRIEDGARRVDPDDLTALAAALGVGPVALLMPRTKHEDEQVEVTGMRGTAAELHGWMEGKTLPGTPEPQKFSMFQTLSLPSWQLTRSYYVPSVKAALLDLAKQIEEVDPAQARPMLDFIQNGMVERTLSDGDD